MSGVSVRCSVCPGQPVLPGRPDADLRRCLRCQGRDRFLPVPHPLDHLCEVCRSECPGCGAPTGPGGGGMCRACRRLCVRCLTPLPPLAGEQAVVERVRAGPPPSGGREARTVVLVPATRGRLLCPACRGDQAAGPEHRVLLALPDPVLRACGGTAPAAVFRVIRSELLVRTASQLADRIERRWHNRWSHLPLHRTDDGTGQGGYGPDDVARWLVEPGRCTGGCEDGWMPGSGEPCPLCQPPPRPPRPAVAPSAVAADMAATARDAIRRSKAARPRGGYLPPEPAPAGEPSQAAQAVIQRAGGPATRRRDMTPTQQRADPVRARAIERSRLERRGQRPAPPAPADPATVAPTGAHPNPPAQT